jgi:hypothetical protein
MLFIARSRADVLPDPRRHRRVRARADERAHPRRPGRVNTGGQKPKFTPRQARIARQMYEQTDANGRRLAGRPPGPAAVYSWVVSVLAWMRPPELLDHRIHRYPFRSAGCQITRKRTGFAE